MLDEIDFVDDSDFGVQAVDFSRKTAQDLYRAGFGSPELLARWDRIRAEIRFEDVVEAAHGTSQPVISCPFHGRDSRPSFYLYKKSNDGYCFGCPQGQQYYDSVRFVAAKYGYTRAQAIKWLEKQYDLPPLEGLNDEDDEDEDDEDDTVIVTLNYSDLVEPYIACAAQAFAQNPQPELARQYIEIFFDCLPDKNANLDSEDELKRAMPLARVLGSEAIEAIKLKRFGK